VLRVRARYRRGHVLPDRHRSAQPVCKHDARRSP
jgi:hypothetical protein